MKLLWLSIRVAFVTAVVLIATAVVRDVIAELKRRGH
jgi:hypothetical protein